MKRLLSVILGVLLLCSSAAAQQPVVGIAKAVVTINSSIAITTGATFQTLVLPAGGSSGRQSLTIENNNTNTDNCWVYIGSGSATAATAILLGPGGSYQRYWPYVPTDPIQVTCATTADTLYVDTQ